MWTCLVLWSGALAAAQPAGIVKIVRGEVAIERPNERQQARAGNDVQPGDRVVTGRDSSRRPPRTWSSSVS